MREERGKVRRRGSAGASSEKQKRSNNGIKGIANQLLDNGPVTAL